MEPKLSVENTGVITSTVTALPGIVPAETPIVPAGESKESKMTKERKPNQQAVIARARQLARSQNRKIWQALGIPGEFSESEFQSKIEEMVKSGQAGKSEAERAGSRLSELEKENSSLKAKVSDLQSRLTKSNKEVESAKGQIEAMKIESEIQQAARDAGVVDLDYGIDLFKRHVKSLPEDKEPNLAEFFSNLKQDPKRKFLFREQDTLAGPKTIAETTPAESKPAIVDPAPKPSEAKQVEPKVVDSMNSRDFARHSQDQYGYRPGA